MPPWRVPQLSGAAAAAAAAAQACAFLNALTAVASESISQQGVDVSAFQSFLNYALLGLVYGALRWRAVRAAGGRVTQLAVPLRHYLLLAAVDVEANYLIVKAYQFTNITSVTLLDSASIPAAMLLSRALLHVAYGARHLAGVAAVLVGFVTLVASDVACRSSSDAAAVARAPLLGDVLAVTAACLYAASNVLQERLLRDAPVGEVLAAFGLLGAALSGAQALLLETRALAAAPWDAPLWGSLWLFAAAMFAIYSLVPRVLPAAGAAAFNLHMLSSDLWAAAARSVAFGGFGGACAAGGFGVSLATVAAGLCVYVNAGAPAGAEAAATAAAAPGEEADTTALLAPEAEPAEEADAAAAAHAPRTAGVELQ